MKKLFAILAAVLLTVSVFAQSPKKMSYQAVIRNSSGELVTNQAVGMQISILQGSENGTAVYVEIQTPPTNANGLVSIEIGGGIGFDTIKWANGPYFIKTETDPAGGTNYTIMGASQLLSVPYALHSLTAENVTAAGKGLQAAGTSVGQMQYWNGTAWVNLPVGSAGQVLTTVNGVPKWGVVATVGTGDVQNPKTGAIWMDRNLGASQVATSSTDVDAYGDLYQFGRGTDGHQLRTSTVITTLSDTVVPGHGNFITHSVAPFNWLSTQNVNLWQGVTGVNNPCPSGYRLPTEAEWLTEAASWTTYNAAGAFDSPLKLTMAGRRTHASATLTAVGTNGQYWTSTVSGVQSKEMFFRDNNAFMDTYHRASGYSIRCIKN